jgi:DNA repair protein RadC
MKTEKPHYLGHRKRVKEKFLKSDPSNLSDYELLEILLFSTYPRKDTKILAKKLIDEFGDINQLISARSDLLKDSKDINEGLLVLVKNIKEIINRSFLQGIEKKIIINNWDQILDYCRVRFLKLKNEEFRILFLDKKHKLIEDHLHNDGSNDNVIIDVEKIIKKSILLTANSVILVHNHPSCDVKPSKGDILTTEKILKSLNAVNIKLIDHLIIGQNKEYYSFKENGLL